MVQPEIDFGCADISYRWASEKGATLVFLMHKPGSGLLLSHLMFMLFLIFLRNMIIKDLTPYALYALCICPVTPYALLFGRWTPQKHGAFYPSR